MKPLRNLLLYIAGTLVLLAYVLWRVDADISFTAGVGLLALICASAAVYLLMVGDII